MVLFTLDINIQLRIIRSHASYIEFRGPHGPSRPLCELMSLWLDGTPSSCGPANLVAYHNQFDCPNSIWTTAHWIAIQVKRKPLSRYSGSYGSPNVSQHPGYRASTLGSGMEKIRSHAPLIRSINPWFLLRTMGAAVRIIWFYSFRKLSEEIWCRSHLMEPSVRIIGSNAYRIYPSHFSCLIKSSLQMIKSHDVCMESSH